MSYGTVGTTTTKTYRMNSSYDASNVEQFFDESYVDPDYAGEYEEHVDNIPLSKEIVTSEPSFFVDSLFNVGLWISSKPELTGALNVKGSFLWCFAASFIEGAYKGTLEQGSYAVANGINYFRNFDFKSFWDTFKVTGAKGTGKALVSFIFGKNTVGKKLVTDTLQAFNSGVRLTWDKMMQNPTFLNGGATAFRGISSNKLDVLLSKLPTGYIMSYASNFGSKISTFFNDKIWNKGIRTFETSSRLNSNGKLTNFVQFTGFDTFGSIMSNFGFALGIDYAGTLLANLLGGVAKNGYLDLSAETMKYGSSALKCSTKIIFQTAGLLIFGEKGKMAGTIVGSIVGDLQTQAFIGENGKIDEKACAVAAGVQVVTAVAAAAAYVFLVSNPVGWAVGLCLIAGAAIGFAVTAIVYNWEKITDWGARTCATIGNFVSTVYQEATEFVKNGIEWVGEQISEATEFVSEIYEVVEDYVDVIVDTAAAVVRNGFGTFLEWTGNLFSFGT